jgi:hypothetical protein
MGSMASLCRQGGHVSMLTASYNPALPTRRCKICRRHKPISKRGDGRHGHTPQSLKVWGVHKRWKFAPVVPHSFGKVMQRLADKSLRAC